MLVDPKLNYCQFQFEKRHFLFQEMFSEGCWEAVSSTREMLKHHGFLYSTHTVEADNYIVNGGTFVGKDFMFRI